MIVEDKELVDQYRISVGTLVGCLHSYSSFASLNSRPSIHGFVVGAGPSTCSARYVLVRGIEVVFTSGVGDF